MRICVVCAWVVFVWGLSTGYAYAETLAADEAPTGLLVDLVSEPLGVENLQPRLSWIVNHSGQDEMQTAYQVRVALTPETLATDDGAVWDSGKVMSAESTNVAFGGDPATPDTAYYWSVRTWNKDGHPSPYSAPQRFVTGLMGAWDAAPIWPAASEEEGRGFAFLRHAFVLKNKPIRLAVAHVTALSPDPASQYVYRLYLNDAFVGAGPPRGFNEVNRYNSFDVTALLRAGEENVIGALNYTAQDQRFLFQMRVVYDDGDSDLILSNREWLALDGNAAIVDQGNLGRGSFYYAPREGIDANHYPLGWRSPGFNTSGWRNAVEKAPIENLRASASSNTELHSLAPERVVMKAPNHFFVDFGRDVLAGIQLNVVSDAGRAVEIRLGEELEAADTVRPMRTGNTYQEVWTLKEGPQVLENWGYRAFRYAEILNAPEGFGADSIRALVLRHPFDDEAAHFASSDPVLNDVWALCKYSIKATALDVYVDTHTRERRNYEGDAFINQLSHYALTREYALPRYSIEYLYFRPTWPAEFKPLSVVMAWEDYMHTGNADSLAAYYDALKAKALTAYVNGDYLTEREPVGGEFGRDLVDWPDTQRDGYVFTPINTVVHAFNCEAIRTLGAIAALLGKDDESAEFAALAEKMRGAMNTHLYDAGQGRFRDGLNVDHHAIHASAIPLALGLVDADKVKPVGDYVASRGMAASVYGAHYVLQALYRAGHGGAALRLMNAVDGNSWGHMMYTLNATIVTEAWDPSQKHNMSFSHAWASSPASTIPRGLFGIVPLEPAFARFQIKPQPGELESAELTIPTIKGSIRAAFRQTAGAFELTATIPANTKAQVYLPIGNAETYAATHNGEALTGDLHDGFLRIDDVGSGTHEFACAPAA